MKKTKTIIGILLIILALSALVYWETGGRNRVITKQVLAAGEDIMKGDIVTAQMISTISVMPETIISGAFRPDEIAGLEGKIAAQNIPKNQQISIFFLHDKKQAETEKLSPFVIKGEWIDNRSSSLRTGDKIKVYNRTGDSFLGDFEILFVKDVNDKEITDTGEDSGFAKRTKKTGRFYDRSHGSGVIDHIEILAELDAYKKVLQFIDLTEEKLLIVQKGENE